MIPEGVTPPIHRFESVDSTNTVIKQLALKGAAEGTVVVSREQTKGRGRADRSWHSPSGGLYVSVLLAARDKRYTDLPILAGVAAAQAIKEFLPKSEEVSLKWPNDVLIEGKKVAGILCEAMEPYCIVGIGINVNTAAADLASFQTNPFKATSFSQDMSGTFDLDKVLDMLVKKLFTLYRLYHKEGFTQIQYLWERNCRFVGKKVEILEDSKKITGTFLGIDEKGALVLSNEQGERRHFVSGEITCYWR